LYLAPYASSVRLLIGPITGLAGTDISGHRSKSVDEFAGESFDYVLKAWDNAKGHAGRFHGNFFSALRRLQAPRKARLTVLAE